MRTYLAPGVYLAPQPPPEADIRLVRTDIAGFVGYAERGPIAPADSSTLTDPTCLAVRLTSWDQYRATFGGLTPYAYMPYAVCAFFQNGGTTCYVARVAASSSTQPFATPQTASFTLSIGNEGTPLTTLSQALTSGQNTLTVASTQGLSAGSVIVIGAVTPPMQAVVATVVDGQNVTLSSPLPTAVAASAPVWLLATTLSLGASSGQSTLTLTSTTGLSPGLAIAIGDVAAPVQAVVASVVNSQYVTLSSPLAIGVPVTAPVWVKQTTVSVAFAAGTTSLTMVSTTGITAGSTIAIGDLTAPPAATAVVATVDGQSLTLTAPLASGVASGAAVQLLSATTLPNGATAGQTQVEVASITGFSPGDTVAIVGLGMQEFATIAGFVNATTIQLSKKLQGTYASGAVLCRQTTGLCIRAKSAGNWGDRLLVNLIPSTPSGPATEFDLTVTLAAGPDPTQPQEAEKFLNLSLDPGDSQFAPSIVNDPVTGSNLIRLEVPDLFTTLPVNGGVVAPFPVTLAGGQDGLSGVTSVDFIGGQNDYRGLRVLEEIDEVGILLAPDAVNGGQMAAAPTLAAAPVLCAAPLPPPAAAAVLDDPTAVPPSLTSLNGGTGVDAIYQAMVDQASRLLYRVAVLETPDNYEPTAANAWLTALGLPAAMVPFAAAYYPWIVVPDGLTNNLTTRRVPPSGHVAGVYAQIDNSVGCWHPPANVELQFAVDVGKLISNTQQGQLNEEGVNVIRAFPGRGIRVWGARSLAAADDDQEEWWFIHIRRTLSMIEDSVNKSMQWTVFESNTATLRSTLTHSLTVLLEKIWLGGGLQGATASQAFFVTCDDTNNPESQIEQGFLVCQVGVAIAAPMEFLTFQIVRQPDATDVVEA